MRIQRLRGLERDQRVTRRMFPQAPPRVDYQLTEWGARLNAALAPVADWGEAYAKATRAYPDA